MLHTGGAEGGPRLTTGGRTASGTPTPAARQAQRLRDLGYKDVLQDMKDVDTWNSGTLEAFHSGKFKGVATADSAKDILNLVRDEKRMAALMTLAKERAINAFSAVSNSRRLMASTILGAAMKNMTKNKLYARGRLGLGVGALGGIAALSTSFANRLRGGKPSLWERLTGQ